MIYLRNVPPELLTEVASGTSRVVGSIIYDAQTNIIRGHLQPTGQLFNLVNMVPKLAHLSSFSPLSAAAVVQNQMVLSKLTEISKTLGVIQNLQYATLGVAGLGLGVSIATFVQMNRRFSQIDAQLIDLGEKVEKVTTDRRDDDLKDLMAEGKRLLENIEMLELRRKAVAWAEGLEQKTEEIARQIEVRFQGHIDKMEHPTTVDLEFLWTLMNALQLFFDARSHALMHLDELPFLEATSFQHAERLQHVSQKLVPIALANAIARSDDSFEKYRETHDTVLRQAEMLCGSIRHSAATAASLAALCRTMIDRDIHGQDYRAQLSEAQDAPLLYLPNSDQ